MTDGSKDKVTDEYGLEFSDKYSKNKADDYYVKHQDSASRRFSDWWEHRMARKALAMAGSPRVILDLPCGAGRFWDLLVEDPERELYAADNSAGMVKVAGESHPSEVRDRFKLFQTSAFNIDMPDESVDNIFCMRLLHHVGDPADRLRIYSEFHRVTRDSTCLSLWVDGNIKASRRRKLDEARASGKKPRKRKKDKSFQNRFVQRVDVLEKEFAEAGFKIAGKVDFLPGYSMWRTYVLKK
jgi:ubiquinone/menaquinone biosynthesis C-methylase UbiE